MTKPEFDIRLVDVRDIYEPGDVLICEYSIQVPDDAEVTAVESSVIWFTDGKGEEDLGVHFSNVARSQVCSPVNWPNHTA